MLEYIKKVRWRGIVLFIAVILPASYFIKVFLNKPKSENIALPEVKIVNTIIQLDNETNKKLKKLDLLLETVKTSDDTIVRLKLKLAIKELDSVFFNKSNELNNIANNNVDSIVKVLNKKIDEINNIQNNIRTVKEDYEYRTDLYQSLILFIVAIIGFFGYSNFKDIEEKAKNIAEGKAEERVKSFTDEKISEIVSGIAEDQVNKVIQDIAENRFNEISKKYDNKLDLLIKEKLDSIEGIENDEIVNLKAEINVLKRRISVLEE